jgi:hypothetical protein
MTNARTVATGADIDNRSTKFMSHDQRRLTAGILRQEGFQFAAAETARRDLEQYLARRWLRFGNVSDVQRSELGITKRSH